MIKIQDMIELFSECKQIHLFGMIFMSSMCEYFEMVFRFCCVLFLQKQKLRLICVEGQLDSICNLIETVED